MTDGTVYAIGDIHGHPDKLRRAHDLIAADRAAHAGGDAPVVHLGDLTDRGPDSRAVIDLLIDGIAGGAPWIVLKGNHDRMFLSFVTEGEPRDSSLREDATWLHPALGGTETLASYGVVRSDGMSLAALHVAARSAVPIAHTEFIAGLPLWYETEAVIFVHAGIRPGVPLCDQTEDDLVWIRVGFLDDNRDHGKLIVHGHTALEAPRHFGNRIDLDGGAA